MKSVLSEDCCKKEEKPFPKLMKHESYGSVYLMTSRSEGTVIHVGHGSTVSLGERARVTQSYMSDYEGDVCLTNG